MDPVSIILGLSSLAFKGISSGVQRKRGREQALEQQERENQRVRESVQESAEQFDFQDRMATEELDFQRQRTEEQMALGEEQQEQALGNLSRSAAKARREDIFGVTSGQREAAGRQGTLDARRRDVIL